MHIQNVQQWYRSLPDKKRYIEFITAFLTVPVLITVLIGNLRNINTQPQDKESNNGAMVLGTVRQTPTPTTVLRDSEKITVTEETDPTPIVTVQETPQPSPPPPQQCNPSVGNPAIRYPTEGENVTINPVCIDITIDKQGYCSVVWSYRINGSAWSEYTDKSFCIYDLPPGQKLLDVKIKSIVSGDEVTRSRTFHIPGPSLTPTPESSSSADL